MPKKISSVKKEALDKTAAMFEVTSLPKEELSTRIELVSDKSGNSIENVIKEREREKEHVQELQEAKELGIEEPIVESTNNEILQSLQKDLEESRERYIELSEEKNKILEERNSAAKKAHELSKQNEILIREKENLQKKIDEISSSLDLTKTDYSRELVDCKIQIEDLQKSIEAYEQNESNYKFEITKLKAEISNLETALTEQPEAKKRLENNLHKPAVQARIPMYQTSKKPRIPSASKANGYDSWN